jgi:hypothetical protein
MGLLGSIAANLGPSAHVHPTVSSTLDNWSGLPLGCVKHP